MALLTLQVISYGFALWLGLYLLSRDFRNVNLRYASFGLISYALVLAGDALRTYAPGDITHDILTRLTLPAIAFPAVFWFLSLTRLFADDERPLAQRLYQSANPLLIGFAALYILSATTNIFFDFDNGKTGSGYWLYLILLVPLLGLALGLLVQRWQSEEKRQPIGLILLATLFFGLGIGIILVPLEIVAREWLILAIGLDLLVFGYAVAILDAFEQGESLQRHFVRAFDISLFTTVVFGGQVGLVMSFGAGATFGMVALLFSIITAAIAMQMFYAPFARVMDNLAFGGSASLTAERNSLRTEAEVLARVNNTLDISRISQDEFVRLTRRALRDFGNLPRLATNPLTRLPLVLERLKEREIPPNTLERAAELKEILTESIASLKPRDQGDLGTSDEWRHYNSLYYPYVVGLRPYSRRTDNDFLSDGEKEVLDWFMVQVPERTMYNWQKAAAELVVQDLQERMVQSPSREPVSPTYK
ncbi:MAG: hypothetical protein L0154_03550 [Chloroflexi bacterium]|nr:hypothetical protein [Chloroflexota bacterium]